jgi:hypothetical protein
LCFISGGFDIMLETVTWQGLYFFQHLDQVGLGENDDIFL